jgi:ATP-binding cassette, subfamily B, bacterial
VKYPYYQQHDAMDCGPTCLRMITKFFGRNFSMQYLRDFSGIGKDGVSLLGLAEALEKLGVRASGVQISLPQLEKAQLPAILHWNHNHFVVLYNVRKGHCLVADPAKGMLRYTYDEFREHFYGASNKGQKGHALLLEPTAMFNQGDPGAESKVSFNHFLSYLLQYRKLLFQLALGLLVGTALQLILPFLTQSVVDEGIATQNLSFIYLILVGQFMLLLGRTSVDFIRS